MKQELSDIVNNKMIRPYDNLDPIVAFFSKCRKSTISDIVCRISQEVLKLS